MLRTFIVRTVVVTYQHVFLASWCLKVVAVFVLKEDASNTAMQGYT